MRTYLSFFAVISLFLGMSGPVSALTTASNNSILVGTDTTISDTYMAGGGTVDLSGKFENDVIIGGGNITISGPVKGDILVGGGNVKISGQVDGNVRLTGGSLEISSKVGKNVTIAGGTMTFTSTADIQGEVIAAGGIITFDGHYAKNVSAWGGNIIVKGSFDQTVALHTHDDCGEDSCVTVGPNTIIKGDLTYWAATDALIDAGATITGKTVRHPVELYVNSGTKQLMTVFGWFGLLSSLVIGLAFSLFIPKTIHRVSEVMAKRMGLAIGIGAAVFFGLPIALILVSITVVGIPLALVLGLLSLMALYVSQIFLGYAVGQFVFSRLKKQDPAAPPKKSKVVWTTLAGLLILALVFDFLLGRRVTAPVAILGFLLGLVRLVLTLWTFGALIMVKWNMIREKEA